MSPERTKVAFVTGASSGIGLASCITLAKSGYKVYAGARRVDSMRSLEQYGIIPIKLDVCLQESILEAKAIIELENDHLDVLFNNAGILCGGPAIEITEDDFSYCFEVNLYGPIRVTKAFSELVIKGNGVLAYTNSIVQILPFPYGSIYSASKAGLSAYISTLALEMKPFNVKVVEFITGGVKTELASSEKLELKPDSLYRVDGVNYVEDSRKWEDKSAYMDVEKYASKVVSDIEHAIDGRYNLFNRNFFTYYRGKNSTVTWLLTTFFPRFLVEKMMYSVFHLDTAFRAILKQIKKQ